MPVDPHRTSLGNRLVMLREEVQLSQELVGERTDADRELVQFWELDRAAPMPEHLDRLASLYEVSKDWIVGESEFRREVKLEYQADYSHDEFERIREGFDPQDMDDKWEVFLEEDVLHFHRSWTGFCMFQITFGRHGDRFVVSETLAEGSEGYLDEVLLRQLIDLLLLGK